MSQHITTAAVAASISRDTLAETDNHAITPGTPIQTHPSAQDDRGSISESSYAGSDEGTVSERGIDEAFVATDTPESYAREPAEARETSSEVYGSGLGSSRTRVETSSSTEPAQVDTQNEPSSTSSSVGSTHDHDQGRSASQLPIGNESPESVQIDSAPIPVAKNNEARENESMADFLREVPGPSKGGRQSEEASQSGAESSLRRPSGTRMASGDDTIGILGAEQPSSRILTGQPRSSPALDSNLRPIIPLAESRRQGVYFEDTTGPSRNTSDRQRPRRATGEIVLPRWQPDAEVTYCPICSTQFSFFVRKHHCRKCGRVVCNACSPHRITIPYQFIVSPPVVPGSSLSSGSENRNNEGSSAFGDRNGGMKVRLCNPCVPDPNTIPPQQQSGGEGWSRDAPPTYYLNTGNRPYSMDEETLNNLEREAGSLIGQRDGGSARARGMSAASGLSQGDRRQSRTDQLYNSRYGGNISGTAPGQGYADRNLRLPPLPGSQPQRVARSPYYPPSANSSQSRGHASRHQSMSVTSTGATANPQPHYRSLLDLVNDPFGTQANNDSRPLPPIPRIAEEDECPICHLELPSRTVPNFEDVRAQHIMQCIDRQLSAHSGHAPRPGAYTSASQPATSTSSPAPGMSSSASSSSSTSRSPPSQAPPVPGNRPVIPTPIANTPEARTAAREQAHAAVVFAASSPSRGEPARRTGMFPYRATEKDCVDDAECTICLEEFEVGVGMARLECLCRFHSKCIREWFVNHPGRCPVHQHDGYGY